MGGVESWVGGPGSNYILYFSSVIPGHTAWSWRRDSHGGQTGEQTNMECCEYRACSPYLPVPGINPFRKHDLHWRPEYLDCFYVDEFAFLLVVSKTGIVHVSLRRPVQSGVLFTYPDSVFKARE